MVSLYLSYIEVKILYNACSIHSSRLGTILKVDSMI